MGKCKASVGWISRSDRVASIRRESLTQTLDTDCLDNEEWQVSDQVSFILCQHIMASYV